MKGDKRVGPEAAAGLRLAVRTPFTLEPFGLEEGIENSFGHGVP